MLKRSSKIGVHCHQSMHQKYNTQSSNNVTSKIEPSFDPSIYETPRIQPLHCPPSSPHFISPRAGSMQIIFLANNQQSDEFLIGDQSIPPQAIAVSRGFIIFPSIFSSLKGIHPPFFPSIAPCRAKGKYFMEFFVAGTLWARVTTL